MGYGISNPYGNGMYGTYGAYGAPAYGYGHGQPQMNGSVPQNSHHRHLTHKDKIILESVGGVAAALTTLGIVGIVVHKVRKPKTSIDTATEHQQGSNSYRDYPSSGPAREGGFMSERVIQPSRIREILAKRHPDVNASSVSRGSWKKTKEFGKEAGKFVAYVPLSIGSMAITLPAHLAAGAWSGFAQGCEWGAKATGANGWQKG